MGTPMGNGPGDGENRRDGEGAKGANGLNGLNG